MAGDAQHPGPGRDVAMDTRLGADLGAVADRHVVGQADLAGEDDATADPTRPRDPRLRHDDGVRANHGIMADLHQVVDFRAAADDRGAHGRAVDRHVGADLDVILDDDPADLGDLAMARPVEDVAEAVGPQDGPGVDDDPAADLDVLPQDHVGVQHAALPHPASGSEDDVGMQNGPGLHDAVRPHHRVGEHGCVGGHAGRVGDDRRRVHPGGGRGLGVEEAEESGDGEAGLGDADHRPARQLEAGRDEERRGLATLGGGLVARPRHEAQVARARLLQGR